MIREEKAMQENEKALSPENTSSQDNTMLGESDEALFIRQKQEIRLRSKKLRKKVIPILAISLAALIVLPILLTLLLQSLQKQNNDPQTEYPEYVFSKPYDGNILEYDAYLRLNREIGYYDNMKGYDMRDTVTAEHDDPNLRFLYRYLQAIINGDKDAYNAMFNETYFKTHSPQAEFEQQMLYEMCIYFYSTEDVGNGERLYSYSLEYKISKNNGTFRRDIGSDMIHPVFVVLRVDANGGIAIENLVPKKVINQN